MNRIIVLRLLAGAILIAGMGMFWINNQKTATPKTPSPVVISQPVPFQAPVVQAATTPDDESNEPSCGSFTRKTPKLKPFKHKKYSDRDVYEGSFPVNEPKPIDVGTGYFEGGFVVNISADDDLYAWDCREVIAQGETDLTIVTPRGGPSLANLDNNLNLVYPNPPGALLFGFQEGQIVDRDFLPNIDGLIRMFTLGDDRTATLTSPGNPEDHEHISRLLFLTNARVGRYDQARGQIHLKVTVWKKAAPEIPEKATGG